MSILCLLGANESHVNDIIRQTSLDRTHVIGALGSLESARFIEIRGKYTQGHRKVYALTELGSKLFDLIHQTDLYNTFYRALKATIKENFSHEPNNDDQRIIGTLKVKGWTDAEIESYNKLHSNSFELLGLLSPSEIIRAITVRYVSVSLDLFIEENKMAMDVLTSLWTMLIEKELSFLKSEIFNDDFITERLKYNLGWS